MADWDDVQNTISVRARELREIGTNLQNLVDEYEKTMTDLVEKAKNDEILAELKRMNARMSAIEARLPSQDTAEG